ncbi:Exocyst complex component S5 [Coemansia biformis]|uniref:Exocyst complex component SEC5 n=1 Tax=Coemansia biformis TaxID=1286918 RepID=A0A9W7YDW1_9FUNG|nr:Exocyst complex component S5 [Coemansia biformis]
MPPIDDAEILARYGLGSFTATTFGAGDAAGEGGGNVRPASALGLEESPDLPTSAPRRSARGHKSGGGGEHQRRHGGERERGGGGGGGEGNYYEGEDDDDGDDYDDDYDDDDYDDDDEHGGRRRRHDLAAGGRGGGFRIPISDRDPLHVYRSVAEVLEGRGDGPAMGDMAYRAQFSISSKGFSPAAFMQTVHNDTSYGDLVQGARLLRESVSQGTEALKILVHNNFDRFVDARSKIDLLYDEMKKRSLNDQAEYGTRAFNQSLQSTTRKADDIYSPIIDRRARAEKIRSTLSVIERYKFYFSLPSSLIDYTRKGRFDIAVREYKKGRQLLEAVTDDGAADEPGGGDLQGTPLSRIFQHVWKEVQESVVELRNALFRRLGQASRSFGEQENIIRHLLEIDPGDKDPVAFHLEHQHMWIVEKLEEDYKEHRLKALQMGAHQPQIPPERLRAAGRPASSGAGPEAELSADAEHRAGELTRALGIESFDDFPAFSHGRDAAFHAWKQIYGAVRALSQTLVRRLPDFWKLCQAYMEEMYQRPAAPGAGRRRRQGVNLERVSKCHSLLEGIIERYSQYVLRLVGILGESDTVVSLESMARGNIGATLQRVPQAHALLAGHFMTAIAELVVNTAGDIEAIDMAQEPAIILANLTSQLKAGLMLFLCEMWDRDARSMSLHESWCLHHGTGHWPPLHVLSRDRQGAEDSPAAVADTIANTELLPLFLRTAQTITGQLGTIQAVSLQPGKSTRTAPQGQAPHFDASFDEGQRQQSERSRVMHDMAMGRVKRTFFGTMYSFLDTLHALAFGAQPGSDGCGDAAPAALQLPRGRGAVRRQSFSLPPRGSGGGGGEAAAAAGRRFTVAGMGHQLAGGSSHHGTSSFCLLATLCNLAAFRLFVVPDLLHAKAVRYTFKLDVTDELPRLEKLLRRLDEMVFSYYIRDKAQQLGAIVRRGVLMGGFGWATAETPKDVQPYVSEALLFLVFTHAEIMDLIAEVGAGAEHHMVKQQPLTKRVFQALTAALAQDLLECIRAVDVFSEGGMLQCVLETLVISQTLQMYMTAPATESFRLLHAYVRAAHDRAQERARKLAAQQGRALPQPSAGDLREEDGVALSASHWDTIRKLLRECTRRTQIQFRCFQPGSAQQR